MCDREITKRTESAICVAVASEYIGLMLCSVVIRFFTESEIDISKNETFCLELGTGALVITEFHYQ